MTTTTKYQVNMVGRDGSRRIVADGFDSMTMATCWALSHQHMVFDRLVAELTERNLRPQAGCDE